LRSYDLMSIVDGSDVLPQFIVNAEGNATAVNPTYQLRQKKDQFILAWFNATLNDCHYLIFTPFPNIFSKIRFFKRNDKHKKEDKK